MYNIIDPFCGLGSVEIVARERGAGGGGREEEIKREKGEDEMSENFLGKRKKKKKKKAAAQLRDSFQRCTKRLDTSLRRAGNAPVT